MSNQVKESSPSDIRSAVRERYGKLAGEFNQEKAASCCEPGSNDSTCCAPSAVVDINTISKIYEAPDAAQLPDDVTNLSLGCGDPVTLASLKPGETVLDLGSGGGIDCFLAAKRVGDEGFVIGVDMTSQMDEKARLNKVNMGIDNVEFRLGEIEHLPVADNSVDVIISNCVINLSPDKPQVFKETYRVLRSGGKIAVSDIVTSGPLPENVKANLSAWAGCIAGALDVNDYMATMEVTGFVDVILEPVYFPPEMIDEALEDLGEQAAMAGDREPDVYKSVFSAKITARKP
jgi:SAM-dependent methyltransferase